MKQSKASNLKLKKEPPYKIFRRTTKDHPWRLICSTDMEAMARVSYSQCSKRYPGQEIRIEGFTVDEAVVA